MMSHQKKKQPPVPKISTADMIPESGLISDPATSELSDPQLRDKPAQIDHDAHRFHLEPLSPPEPAHTPIPAYEHLGELPSSYGTRKLYLTARDPRWLFCYWDLDFDQLAVAERSAHDGKVFLQIYLENASRIQQIHITPGSREWMIHTNRPNTRFYAEIGYYRYDGTFEVISRSGIAASPRDTLSENTSVQFATIPFHLTFSELRDLLKELSRENEGLAQTLARLQNEGYPLPFEHYRGKTLTQVEHQRFLEQMGAELIKHTWIDSQKIIERLTNRFQLNRTASSDNNAPWPPSSHWHSGSSISSPFGDASHDFSMQVNAELILYGRTHPNASLRIEGENVDLDENGNFHLRFNFKDGNYHIPVEATSADETKMSTTLLSFLRMTTTDNVKAAPHPKQNSPREYMD